eukprot:1117831-Prymnesium_polylepis.1
MCGALRLLQELARAKEAAKQDRENRRAEKAEKLEMARARAAQRQATTGLKNHKSGPTTAGAPLVAIAWEPVAAMCRRPCLLFAFEPIPVAIGPMPPYDRGLCMRMKSRRSD